MDDREFKIRLAASKTCRKYDPFKPWGTEMRGRALKVRLSLYATTLRDMYRFYRDMYGGNRKKRRWPKR